MTTSATRSPRGGRWPRRRLAAMGGLAAAALTLTLAGPHLPDGAPSGGSDLAGDVEAGAPVEVTTPATPRSDAAGPPSVPPGEAPEPPGLPQRETDADFVDDGMTAPDDAPAAEDGDDDDRARRARRLAAAFPEQAAAEPGEAAASRRWALVVGVDDYRAGVRDTLGSVADARVLSQLLVDRGWRDDHVLTLTDGDATGEMIRAGLDWLAARTGDDSRVVVSFSGHLRHRDGVTALWPTDDDYLWAGEVGDRLAGVDAEAMWLSFQGCHAQGLATPELYRDGRVITYSSTASEKSHEDPETGHSVQGYYLFAEGLRDRLADAGTATVSVQQAFRRAAPRARARTAGRQTPQMWDGLGEPFTLPTDGR